MLVPCRNCGCSIQRAARHTDTHKDVRRGQIRRKGTEKKPPRSHRRWQQRSRALNNPLWWENPPFLCPAPARKTPYTRFSGPFFSPRPTKRAFSPVLHPCRGPAKGADPGRGATGGPRGRQKFPTQDPLAGTGRPFQGRPVPPFPPEIRKTPGRGGEASPGAQRGAFRPATTPISVSGEVYISPLIRTGPLRDGV